MGAYIYRQDGEGPESGYLLSGRHRCQLIWEMLEFARDLKRAKSALSASYEYDRDWEHESSQYYRGELLATHEVLPYTLEAYLTYLSNRNESRTCLIYAMKAELSGDTKYPRVMVLFDEARDFIRRCALEEIDINISL